MTPRGVALPSTTPLRSDPGAGRRAAESWPRTPELLEAGALPTPRRISAPRKRANGRADWRRSARRHRVLPMVISCRPSAWALESRGRPSLRRPPESHLTAVGTERVPVDVTSVGGKEGPVRAGWPRWWLVAGVLAQTPSCPALPGPAWSCLEAGGPQCRGGA